MLPMLTVSGTPGLIYLNGRLCGETGAAAMPLARDGVQYLEVRPFDLESKGAVLRLRLADGRLVEGVRGNTFAVQWPDGWIALELRGETEDAVSDAAEPMLLSQINMPGGLYLLVDEGGMPTFGRDAQEAVFLPVEGVQQASLRPLPYPALCAAEGYCAGGRFAAILRAEDRPDIIHCACGASVQMDAQGMLQYIESADDLVGHASICVVAPDMQGNYTFRSRETAWAEGGPRWPRTPSDTARAWLEALQIEGSEEAAGYLLRPELCRQLQQRAGAFDAVTELPPDGTEGVRYGVLHVEEPNLAIVKRLDFIMVRQPSAQGEWKIKDVTEHV